MTSFKGAWRTHHWLALVFALACAPLGLVACSADIGTEDAAEQDVDDDDPNTEEEIGQMEEPAVTISVQCNHANLNKTRCRMHLIQRCEWNSVDRKYSWRRYRRCASSQVCRETNRGARCVGEFTADNGGTQEQPH